MANKFKFTGKLALDQDKWLTKAKTKAGKEYASVRASVIHSKNNRAFIEFFGQMDNEIKAKDRDRNDITIKWADRKNPDVIKAVSLKYVLSLSNDERYEFISLYDMALAMEEHLDELKDKMVTVTGRIQKNIYNGKISDRFTVQNIYVVPDDIKPKFETDIDFFYNKDSVDGTDFKDDKKVYINGYIYDYIDKDNGSKYLPHQVIVNASKLDLADDYQSKRLAAMLSVFKAKREDMKVVSIAKNSDYYKMSIRTSYVQGAEEVEFNENLLTDFQKEMLSIGICTLDDFKPKGQTFGERVVVYNVTGFEARDEYADGPIDVAKAKEFEENIYAAPAPAEETIADLDDAINPPKDESQEDSDFDLFS